jgi:hypothetical protein
LLLQEKNENNLSITCNLLNGICSNPGKPIGIRAGMCGFLPGHYRLNITWHLGGHFKDSHKYLLEKKLTNQQ